MTAPDLEGALRARYVERAAHAAPTSLRDFVATIPEADGHPTDVVARTERRVTGARMARPAAAAALLLAVLGATWVVTGSRPAPTPTFAPGTIAIQRDGDLYLLSPDEGDTPTWAASGGVGGIFQIAFAPDGGHIAYSRITGDGTESSEDDTEVVIMAADGETVGSHVGRSETQLAWAPDGRRLAVLGDDDSSAIIGLDGHVDSQLALPAGWMTTFQSITEWASWSPDGRSIAVPGCARPCEPKHGLDFVIAAADGSGWRSAHPDDPAPLGPGSIAVWSPDSTLALIDQVDETGQPQAPRVDIRSAAGEPLQAVELPDPSFVKAAAWSQDGSTLALVGHRADGHVALVGADGSSRTMVAHPAPDGAITWSADGMSLVYPAASPGSERWSLWAVSTAGGPARRLIDDVDGFSMIRAPDAPSANVDAR